MKPWVLVDCLEPLEEDQDNPRTAIGSEAELRRLLQQMQQRSQQGLAMLDSPQGDAVVFSIGGEFGTLGWRPPVAKESFLGRKEAQPRRQLAKEPAQCLAEGIPTVIAPEYLFTSDEVVDAILYFYRYHRLSEELTWRQWNPTSLSWESTQSNGVAGAREFRPERGPAPV